MSLSFADVICFFISVYLLIGISEKCQNILFLLLKRRKILDFHRCGIPSYFSFPKQSFVEPHTVISEVYFNNREFHSLIFGVIFGVIFTILGVILCFLGVISLALSIILCLLGVILGVIQNFLSTFLLFCPLFCLLFRFNVHHLNYLVHRFHCFGVHFRVHFGVHSKFWGSYYRTAILFDKLWKM